MKYLKKIINRLTIVSLALLIQLVWLVAIPFSLIRSYYWLSIIFSLLSLIVVAFIINKQSDPAIKLAWIVPILVFPFLGWVIYLMFGTKLSTYSIKKKLSGHTHTTVNRLPNSDKLIKNQQSSDSHIAMQMNYVAKNSFPVYQNTSAKYYPIGDEWFPDLIEEMKKAEKFIFIEFFIIKDGFMWSSILEILKEKAKKGLDIRVIYDDVGSINHIPSKYFKQLEALGIKCIAFNRFRPFLSIVMNNRDHRKIVVIDGNVGFTGGANIADEYINKTKRFGHWKDAAIMLKGEATATLTALFLEMWNGLRPTDTSSDKYMPGTVHPCEYDTDGLIQPYGDSPLDNEILGENIYLNIINTSTKYVYIFTPYIVIDHVISEALCLAAKRGVDVRIVIPSIPDKKIVYQLTLSHCPALIKAGVKIYNYTPGFIHSKCFVCDDKVATVGTINMDYRSLYIHFECGCLFYNSTVVSAVYKDALDTLSKSELLVIKNKRKGLLKNFYYALLRLFAPLL